MKEEGTLSNKGEYFLPFSLIYLQRVPIFCYIYDSYLILYLSVRCYCYVNTIKTTIRFSLLFLSVFEF